MGRGWGATRRGEPTILQSDTEDRPIRAIRIANEVIRAHSRPLTYDLTTLWGPCEASGCSIHVHA